MWMREIVSVLYEMDKRRWRTYGAARELILVGGSDDSLGAFSPASKTLLASD
jgi:hypothetical protein